MLPFTYRTFGVSGAQPQSHHSQHAGYSQHLLGGAIQPRERRGGLRRPLSSSLLSSSLLFLCFFSFSVPLFSISASFSCPPSPSYSTPQVLSPPSLSLSLCLSLFFRQSARTVHRYVGQGGQRGVGEGHRAAATTTKKTHLAAP